MKGEERREAKARRRDETRRRDEGEEVEEVKRREAKRGLSGVTSSSRDRISGGHL